MPVLTRLEGGKTEPCLRSLQTLADSFEISISQLMRGL